MSIFPNYNFGADVQNFVSEMVSLENTLERFYIIQRIDPLVCLMEKIKIEFWVFPKPTFDYFNAVFDDVTFKNEHIVLLLHSIDQAKSITPIFHLWTEFKRYKYLPNIEMVKEFLQVLFIVTRYSLRTHFPTIFEENEHVKNIYFLNSIQSLSLEEMLDILDLVIEDLPLFIEKFELNSLMSWKDWMKKYWIVAPIAIMTFLVKVYIDYRHLKRDHNHSYNQYDPRQNNFGNRPYDRRDSLKDYEQLHRGE